MSLQSKKTLPRADEIRLQLTRLAFALLLGLAAPAPTRAADSGASVFVVFNRAEPESRRVAEHYAQQRQVPAGQVLGLALPKTDAMTRAEFREQLEAPLLKALEAKKLFTFKAETNSSGRVLVDAQIRYLVLCYGVPFYISRDESLVESEAEKLPPLLRRNEAAVDSELALLPMTPQHYSLTGPLRNLHYGATNAAALHPMNGLLLVARLDGPTPDIARGLVDKARQAETNGLWGRAYFDLRGLTNSAYAQGDDWLRGAATFARRYGFETVVDDKPETLPAGFPLSHVAFYAGWYDEHFSGPFRAAKVEFMPGAFAYHLHSFSGHKLRAADRHWCGPLLATGVAATMGSVDEPYLTGTPDLAVFTSRWLLLDFSFGEAAWAAQSSLSWMTTVVGDPLYRPFGQNPAQLHAALARRKSSLVEWSNLRVVNLQLQRGAPVARAVEFLEKEPEARESAVLQEKLANLYAAQSRTNDAVAATGRALKLATSPLQKLRLLQTQSERLAALGRFDDAAEQLREALKLFPAHSDTAVIQEKIRALIEKAKAPAGR
ncbi:MAG: TIGR03790 family protein [Verrucomicrobia bacterium]|nr:TIGR03790 family protein [Verrucomicrobiota bacterium]